MSNFIIRLIQHVRRAFRPLPMRHQRVDLERALQDAGFAAPLDEVEFFTRSGPCVYLALYLDQSAQDPNEAVYKIGLSKDPARRLYDVSTHSPYPLKPICCIETNDAKGLEAFWHKRFPDKRMVGSAKKKSSEYFELSKEEAAEFSRYKELNNKNTGAQLHFPSPEEDVPKIDAVTATQTSVAYFHAQERAIADVNAYYNKLMTTHPTKAKALKRRLGCRLEKREQEIQRLRNRGFSEAQALDEWVRAAFQSANKKIGQ